MAQQNIIMHQKAQDGTFDDLYPRTTSGNVLYEGGGTVQNAINNLNEHGILSIGQTTVSSFQNGVLHYIKYADGRCKIYGVGSISSDDGVAVLSLPSGWLNISRGDVTTYPVITVSSAYLGNNPTRDRYYIFTPSEVANNQNLNIYCWNTNTNSKVVNGNYGIYINIDGFWK